MIKDLPVNTNGKLTGDVKKVLIGIIEKEFTNKDSLYHQVQEAEERKIIEAYKASIGFPKLEQAYKRAEKRVEDANKVLAEAGKAIEDNGLSLAGEPSQTHSYVNGVYTTNYTAVALHKKLSAIADNAPSQNLKSKLLSRLMLSTTIGEANEIMREVLGNGIIPATDIKAIDFKG